MTTQRRGPAVAPAGADWDPHGTDVLADQRSAYDEMRSRCPVARDASGGWTVFRHADVMRVLHDHQTFSNVVSRHVSVPNGMDPPAHTVFRLLIEPYLSEDRVDAFGPVCRAIAAALVDEVCDRRDVELMAELALPFAARAQCAYLGWPMELADPAISWAISGIFLISSFMAAAYSHNDIKPKRSLLFIVLSCTPKLMPGSVMLPS